ncbi:UNVERIFIED_CONTAM: hypothetical protein RMT77_017638 [Armadillidium vulgare]
MYNISRLDPIKLLTYRSWVEKGRPLLTSDNSPDLEVIKETAIVERIDERPETVVCEENEMINEAVANEGIPIIDQSGEERNVEGNEINEEPSFHSPVTSTPISFLTENRSLFEVESNLPGTSKNLSEREYLKNVPLQDLLNEIQSRFPNYEINLRPIQKQKSIEEVLHGRGRVPNEKPKCRRAVQTKSAVITNEDILTSMKEREVQKSKKCVTRKTKQKSGGIAYKKRQNKKKIEETTSESDDLLMSDSVSDYSEESFSDEAESQSGERSTLPKICSIELHKYFAVYYEEPKRIYYWGKVEKIFRTDAEEGISSVEMKFLKRNHIGIDPADWSWKESSEDVEIVNVKYIFYGPELPTIRKGIFYFNDIECFKVFDSKVPSRKM